MKNRFTLRVAVYLLIKQNEKILFMKRAGSGYMDGFYSLPAGHLEGKETLKAAMIREAKEEINIDIKPEDLDLELTLHRNSPAGEYIDVFFSTKKYFGHLKVNEPEKCADLGFYNPQSIENSIIPYVRQALRAIDSKTTYLEADW